MSPAFCGAICLTVQDGVIQVMRVRDEVPVRRVEAPAERSSLNEFMESLMHNCLVKGFFGEATAKVVQSEVTRYSFERVMKEPSEE